MASQDGAFLAFLLFTSIALSSTSPLKRDLEDENQSATCQEELVACRPQEPFNPSWSERMLEADGSLKVNCTAVEYQSTCVDNMGENCKGNRRWLRVRVRITMDQQACTQPEVFTSGRQCWKNIQETSALRECGFCGFAECLHRVMPRVSGCMDSHVSFLVNMAAAMMRHFDQLNHYQC